MKFEEETEKDVADDITAEDDPTIRPGNGEMTRCQLLRDYMVFRWKLSTVRKLYVENHLTASQGDSIVNTITLLNALLLTVPFQIMGNLGNSYWDWLDVAILNCADTPNYASWNWQQVYDHIQNALFASVYSTLISVVLAVLYYLLRPERPTVFKIWWGRSKWVIVIMMITTIISIISILTLFGYLAGNYINSTNHLCAVDTPLITRYIISNAIAVFLFISTALYACMVMF